MRNRALAVLAVLLFLVINPGTTSAQTLWQIFLGSLPRISSPAYQQITGSGVGGSANGITVIPNGDISIFNGARAPMVAEIYAVGVHVAELGPGRIYNSKIYFQNQYYSSIPLMAFLFAQKADGKTDPGRFVGIATKMIYLNSYPTSWNWSIGLDDIVTPSGRPYSVYYPGGPTNLQIPFEGESMRYADIAIPFVGGTTELQIGNSSNFIAEIFINGRKIATLKPAGFCFLEYENAAAGVAIPYTLQVNYLQDAGGGHFLEIGSGSAQVSLNPTGVHAYQIVIVPPTYGGLRVYGG